MGQHYFYIYSVQTQQRDNNRNSTIHTHFKAQCALHNNVVQILIHGGKSRRLERIPFLSLKNLQINVKLRN